IITRVRLFGIVLQKGSEKQNYTDLVIDDGSGAITLRSWNGLLTNIAKGMLIEVIGRIQVVLPHDKQFDYEVYLNPEQVTPQISRDWELVHRLELLRTLGSSMTLDDLPPAIAPDSLRTFSSTGSQQKTTERDTSFQTTTETKGKMIETSTDKLSADLEQIIQIQGQNGINHAKILETVFIPGIDEQKKEELITDSLFQLLMNSKIFEPVPDCYRHINTI
ncbi:MAG: OB-fold nucleic acid binding domain-containing protein, partial [Candidatus Hodarchaeota archaeon]